MSAIFLKAIYIMVCDKLSPAAFNREYMCYVSYIYV